MKTHYDTLGVPFGADYDTIKAAYRKALKVFHPDLHEGNAAAELHSRRIIDAHAVLKDPEQRERYDEYVLNHRKQRRRLFLITMLISAGSVCGGSLVLVTVAHMPTAMLVTASDRSTPAARLGRPSTPEYERVAKADIPLPSAEPVPRAQASIPSFVTVAPTPPSDLAEPAPQIAAAPTAEPLAPAAAAPTVGEIGASDAGADTQAEKVDLAPAAPAPGETGDAPSSISVAPAPQDGLAEPAPTVAAPAPIEHPASVAQQQETGWADIGRRGNAAEIWKFIQDNPAVPEATLAEKRLEELIETNEDLESLEAVRATVTRPLARRVQARIDMLAPKEMTTGTLAQEAPGKPQVEPLTDPGPQQAAIDPAAAITPRDPKEHVKKGLASLKLGKPALAIASFGNAILLDPGNARYLLHRAAAWESKGDLDQALADYDAAVKLDQTSIATFHGRGLLWRRRGDVERSLADLDRAIRLSFSDAKIYRDRGMVWYGMGRYNRAIADFSRAIVLDPNFPSAYVNRGQAFQKKGDAVTAAINFEKAVSRDPSIVKTHRDLLRGRADAEDAMQKAPQASR